ncbi:MAG TPA: NmrA family NAD(P)-binding protein [Ktedonobacteraceae bacterium]
MNNYQKMILVTGATGQQGGASARHLQARGWSVRALTRDPHTAAARALADAGIEMDNQGWFSRGYSRAASHVPGIDDT